MEILTLEEFDKAITSIGAYFIGKGEGGTSYRVGDDLYYVHYPNGKAEYVLKKGYWKVVPPNGATVYFPLSND